MDGQNHIYLLVLLAGIFVGVLIGVVITSVIASNTREEELREAYTSGVKSGRYQAELDNREVE